MLRPLRTDRKEFVHEAVGWSTRTARAAKDASKSSSRAQATFKIASSCRVGRVQLRGQAARRAPPTRTPARRSRHYRMPPTGIPSVDSARCRTQLTPSPPSKQQAQTSKQEDNGVATANNEAPGRPAPRGERTTAEQRRLHRDRVTGQCDAIQREMEATGDCATAAQRLERIFLELARADASTVAGAARARAMYVAIYTSIDGYARGATILTRGCVGPTVPVATVGAAAPMTTTWRKN